MPVGTGFSRVKQRQVAARSSARVAVAVASRFLPNRQAVPPPGARYKLVALGLSGLPLGARMRYRNSVMLKVLTKRADFVAANKGLRNAKTGFVLLTRPNGGEGVRYGITVTKKIGNAVVRNRMKRRFRELLRSGLPEGGIANHDHVLIGRSGGVERDFAVMREELGKALERARQGKGDAPRGRRPRRSSPLKPDREKANREKANREKADREKGRI